MVILNQQISEEVHLRLEDFVPIVGETRYSNRIREHMDVRSSKYSFSNYCAGIVRGAGLRVYNGAIFAGTVLTILAAVDRL